MSTLSQPEEEPRVGHELHLVENSEPGPQELVERYVLLGREAVEAEAQVQPEPAGTDNVFPAEIAEQLSSRELEVVQHALQGKSNREIALEVFLSEKSVATYLSDTYKKLRVSGRYELQQLIYPDLPESESKVKKTKKSTSRSAGTGSERQTLAALRGENTRSAGRMEKPLTDEQVVQTLGIQAARQLVKMMPPESLEKFDEMKFRLNNPESLEFLLEIEAISADEFEDGEVSVNAVALALIAHTKKGRGLLTGKTAKAHIKVAGNSVRSEIERHAKTIKQVRRGGTGR